MSEPPRPDPDTEPAASPGTGRPPPVAPRAVPEYGARRDGAPLSRTDRIGTLTVVAVLLAVLASGLAYAGIQVFRPVPLDELSPAACLVSGDLTVAESEIDDLRRIECSNPFDAQVLAVVEVSATDAEDWATTRAAELCAASLPTEVTLEDLARDGVEVRPLLESSPPEAGEVLVCVARDATGETLRAAVIDPP